MVDGITAGEKARRCALAKCPLAGQGDERCAKCKGPVVWTDADGNPQGRARSCSSCAMDGLGLPVCWAACPGPRDDFGTDGQSMVTLGAMAGDEGAGVYLASRMACEARIARLPTADYTLNLTPEAEVAVKRLLDIFTTLSLAELKTLHALLREGSGVSAARRLGCSRQNVNQVSKRIASVFPELRTFLFAKERKKERQADNGETLQATGNLI